MAFRIVKVNNRCKLETQLNYLVCRSDKEVRIPLDEIAILIIENQQVCITSALISELVSHKVKVIFCDSSHNPQSELVPQHGAYNTYERIQLQIHWSKEIQDSVWANIISQKIENQSRILRFTGDEKTYAILQGYLSEVSPGDTLNREGLSAKLYFASLFGSDFDRRKDADIMNTYLNYGYSMLLSSVNREISNAGYLPALGIHHIGAENPFNFGCDLMEPFRPFIDRMVVQKYLNEKDFKRQLIDSLNIEYLCDGKVTILENAIHAFCLSVFNALNSNDPSKILKVTFQDGQL